MIAHRNAACDFFFFCRYLPGPDDMLVLDIAHSIYMKFEEYPRALQIALYLDNLQVRTYVIMRCLIVWQEIRNYRDQVL